MYFMCHKSPSCNWNNTWWASWLYPEIASTDTADKSEGRTRLKEVYIYGKCLVLWLLFYHQVIGAWQMIWTTFLFSSRCSGNSLDNNFQLVTSVHPLLIKQRGEFRTALVPLPNQSEKNMITWKNMLMCSQPYNFNIIIYKKKFSKPYFSHTPVDCFDFVAIREQHVYLVFWQLLFAVIVLHSKWYAVLRKFRKVFVYT